MTMTKFRNESEKKCGVGDEMQIAKQINITDLLFEDPVKPDYVRVPADKHTLFCVYCNEVRVFKKDKYLGVYRCLGCGISTKDFYIRRVNRIRD
ncbi:hypothetical protein [Alkalibacter mobilis]|uniref:hypothetical protein n=1 Tax=Alkalibacter mobilis TaxID=2787712 RepID=UPI00189DF8E7|nr:hypothetical protein [Alkalibacter mobilis]MBF7097597.1 hypothetical protein [Alkalibacter mobilis]